MDELTIKRSSGRIYRRWWRHAWARLRCRLFGHDWSEWLIDDMDGPGEYIDGDPDAFMPYTSRPSRPGEWGMRSCQRSCGTSEVRARVCPFCGEAVHDAQGEVAHMEANHAYVINQRLIAAGFVLREGEWIDTLASDS